MDLTIETGAAAFFWGSLLTNFCWTNRKAIAHSTGQYTAEAANYLLRKSKTIFKQLKAKRNTQVQVTTGNPPEVRENQNQIQNNLKDQPKDEAESHKHRKTVRKAKKRKNLRKYTKNYEEWFSRMAQFRKPDESEPNQFKEYLKQMELRMGSDEIVLKKQKNPLANIEDIQKFVEEQVEYEDEDEMNCVLPYDPFVSDEDKE